MLLRPATPLPAELGALSLQSLLAALEAASSAAIAAQRRGYVVGLAIAANPLSVRVVARKKEGERVSQAIKSVEFSRIASGGAKFLLIAIEECIAEIEAFLFGQEYLPIIQANYSKSVDNACKYFVESLEIPLDLLHKGTTWRDLCVKRPIEAAAIRAAMKRAMQGSRNEHPGNSSADASKESAPSGSS